MGAIININQPNIKSIKPPKIIIDTNVLIDVFYSNPSKEITYREKQYQNYINDCVNRKIPLYTTGINIYETFHVIDNINKDIYALSNNTKLTLKEYHKIEDEVKKVHKDCEIIYKSINATIKIISHSTTEAYIQNYINKENSCLDLYDIVLLKTAENEKIKYILTHDSDFAYSPEEIKDFYVLTQNSDMINRE